MGSVVGSIDDACLSLRAWLTFDSTMQQKDVDQDGIYKKVSSKIEGGYFPRDEIIESLASILPLSLAHRVTRAAQRFFEHRHIFQIFNSISKEGWFGALLKENTRTSIQRQFARLCSGEMRLTAFFARIEEELYTQPVSPQNRERIITEIQQIFDRIHINANLEQGQLISVFADTKFKSSEGYKIGEQVFYPNKLSREMHAEEKVSFHPQYARMEPPTQQQTTLFECFAQDPLDAAMELSLRGRAPCIISPIDPSHHGGKVEQGESGSEEDLYRRSNVFSIIDPRYNTSLQSKIDKSMVDMPWIHAEGICVFKKGSSEQYKCTPPALLTFIFARRVNGAASLKLPDVWQALEPYLSPVREKIRGVLRTAVLHNHQDVILPPFWHEGQGLNPTFMAKVYADIFNEAEFKNRFRLVRFALPSFQANSVYFTAFQNDPALRQLLGMPPSIEAPHGPLSKEIHAPPPYQPASETMNAKIRHDIPQDPSQTASCSTSQQQKATRCEHSKPLTIQRFQETSSVTKSATKKRGRIVVDFKRNKIDIPAKVVSISLDPHYKRYLAKLQYTDGEEGYIIAPDGLKVGDEVISSNSSPQLTVGNTTQLRNLPLGSIVHCIELVPGKGARLAVSSGMFAVLFNKTKEAASLRLPSGKEYFVNARNRASLGVVRK